MVMGEQKLMYAVSPNVTVVFALGSTLSHTIYTTTCEYVDVMYMVYAAHKVRSRRSDE